MTAAVAATACSLDQAGLDPVDAAPVERPAPPLLQMDARQDVACATCGPCQRCGSDGGCELDPGSPWEIVCVSAAVAAAPPGRDSWDDPTPTSASAAPDPYCQFVTAAGNAAASAMGLTTTSADTFMPTWNQVVSPPGQTVKAGDLLDPHGTWKLIIGDDDGCPAQQGCIAETICVLSPPMSQAWFTDGEVTMPVAPSCQSLTLRLVCQP